LCAMGALCCAVSGCKSKPPFQLDGIDVLPPAEELKEFSLGQYQIPIPVVDDRNQAKLTRHNRFQFDFTLYALVSPKEKSQMEDAWERHEGQIRDQIINVCRSATLDELQEPEFATLKARLTDVLAAKLGEKPLRQLVLNAIVSQPL
jgi:hypothetical protein